MKIDTLISVLGWEERFLLGMEQIIQDNEVKNIFLISFTDYCSMEGLNENKDALIGLAKQNGITVQNIELNYSDSISNWKSLDNAFGTTDLGKEIMLNITTFPRETIWTFLFFLKKVVTQVRYIYFKPKAYDKVWLTKNHKNPRLLFKHSGVFDLNKPLALFIISGYDYNRLDMITEFYEPEKVVVFCQKGKQFDNLKRNNGLNRNESLLLEKVSFDSYDIDESIEVFQKVINEYSDYNIIISSLGPKTSALSVYKNFLLSDNKIGLAYVPAKDFSPTYSIGIDTTPIEGIFHFSKEAQ